MNSTCGSLPPTAHAAHIAHADACRWPCGRPVRLRTAAQVGAESQDLARQIDRLPESYRPDVAVVIVGGNDVTHRVPVASAAADLADVITRLRARGAEVVVGTCPDLGALRAVPQPLRSLGAQASRQLARAQAVAGERAGARVVSLRRAVGHLFVAHPDDMFSDALAPSRRKEIVRGVSEGKQAATRERRIVAAVDSLG